MAHLSDPRRVTRRRLLALEQHLPLARAGDVESVHQARVASRRLRELLPLLVPGTRPDRSAVKTGRRLRRLTRALGPVRELDVALLTLDALAAAHPEHAPAAGIVRVAVQQERCPAAEHLVATLEGRGLAKARTWMVAAASTFVSLAARRTLAATLSARIAGRTDAAREAVEQAGTVYAQDCLHRARIALKKLRYTIELAEDVGPFRLTGTLRRLKTVQDILGALHDGVVLAGRVRDCAAANDDAARREALSAVAAYLDEDTRARHVEFLRARPLLDVVFQWSRRTAYTLAASGRRLATPNGTQTAPRTAPAARTDDAA